MKQATMPARLEHAAAWLRNKTNARPKTGLILGSGLGDFCDLLENVTEVPFSDIPDFPVATVAGHTGAFLFGTYQGTPVAVLRGRIHCYEGYTPQEVVMPVRLMAMLGVKTVILTNAAGGVNKAYKPGALMLLEDHINFCGANPLTGPNLDQLGPRFPDMSDVYCRQLRVRVQELALAEQIPLEQGMYLMYGGPSYETPAEIRAFRTLGADAVGMSTVPEAIAANHCGMHVLGISCITNMAAGILPQKLSHAEVVEAAALAKPRFIRLLTLAIAAAEEPNDL